MKRIITLVALLFCCTPLLKAQQQKSESCFDEGWLFARYGLQADGSSVDEPASLESPTLSDAAWRRLDLPHDWAIEGPFRPDLEGSTGKLP